jgi:hypothetical protein
MAAKYFTGLPHDGPDPECVHGYGSLALQAVSSVPKPSGDHSHRGGVRGGPVPVSIGPRPCDESPVLALT